MDSDNNHTSKRVALIVATLTSFLTPFLLSSVNIALKDIGSEFSLSAVLLSWVSTSYLLASAVILIPIGKIADIHGRKKVFFWGLWLMIASSIGATLVKDGMLLITFRALQGIAAAFLYATNVAILSSVYPAHERGRVLGINSSAIYLGLSMGPTLGGFMISLWGWRSIFWATALLCLASFSVARWKLEGEWTDDKNARFDWIGAVIYGLSLVIVMLGFPRIDSFQGAGMVLVGIAGMLAFFRLELKREHPLVDLALFRENRIFAFSCLTALINYSSVTAGGFLLSLYLQHIKGMAPQEAGLVLIAQPVVMALLSPIAGKLSDKIEVQTIVSIGMAVSTLGLGSFIFLGNETQIWEIVAGLVVLGMGYGLFAAPNTNAILGSAGRHSYGIASSIMGTMRLIGQTLSNGIATLVFALYLGQAAIGPPVYPQFLASLKPMFIIFALLSFLGIFASLARGNTRSKVG